MRYFLSSTNTNTACKQWAADESFTDVLFLGSWRCLATVVNNL